MIVGLVKVVVGVGKVFMAIIVLAGVIMVGAVIVGEINVRRVREVNRGAVKVIMRADILTGKYLPGKYTPLYQKIPLWKIPLPARNTRKEYPLKILGEIPPGKYTPPCGWLSSNHF